MSIALGTRLGGDFELLHPLAQGSLTTTYYAIQLSTGRRCAVKALLLGGDAARPLILREPRILLRIPSDHVPQVIAIGADEPGAPVWFAMDYIDGDSLQTSIERGSELGVDRVRDTLGQICQGLDAAHRRGITHSNLTPLRVLLERANGGRPFVKLVGFKHAKSASISDALEPHPIEGNARYMAPEQLASRDLVSPATDIWALGLIAFEMLTLRSYWDFWGPGSLQEHVTLREPLPRASTCAAQLGVAWRIPNGFDAWFARCVARDPSDRFPTATEAWLGLNELPPWTLYSEGPVAFSEPDEDPRRFRHKIRSLDDRGLPNESTQKPAAKPSGIQVFISYSQKDSPLCDELLLHLAMMRRQGLLREWYDQRVDPGADRLAAIEAELERSEAVILLVSADFIASDTCYDVEMRRACEKHEGGEGVVIPVIVRMCEWSYAPFARFSALPANGKAVTSWPNRDEAWFDVTSGIRKAIVHFTALPTAPLALTP